MARNKKMPKWVGLIIVNVVSMIVIASLLLLGVAGFVLVRVTYTEEYIATAVVSVTRIDGHAPLSNELETIAEELESYKEELDAFRVMMYYNFGGDYDFDEGDSTSVIEAEPIDGTSLIKITVSGSNQDEVEAIIEFVSEGGSLVVAQGIDADSFELTLVEEPSTQLGPDNSVFIVTVITVTAIVISVIVSIIFNAVFISALVKDKKKKKAARLKLIKNKISLL